MTATIDWIRHALQGHPELALFLTLSAGHLLGRIRIGPLKLSPVIGVLLAGVAVGQIGIAIPSILELIFFLLFLFTVGYKTGPEFFRGLGWNAIPQVVLAVLLCVTGLVTTYMIARLLRFSAGTAVGIPAGGLNASGAVGTADEAIEKLAINENLRHELTTNVTVAFAVTYLVGLFTGILVLVRIGPWVMRVDLKSECRKLEVELGMDKVEQGVISAYTQFVARSYKIRKLAR